MQAYIYHNIVYNVVIGSNSDKDTDIVINNTK